MGVEVFYYQKTQSLNKNQRAAINYDMWNKCCHKSE